MSSGRIKGGVTTVEDESVVFYYVCGRGFLIFAEALLLHKTITHKNRVCLADYFVFVKVCIFIQPVCSFLHIGLNRQITCENLTDF